MEVFDKHLTDRITVRDKENDITNVPYCNRLSIDEHNTKFDEEFKKLISDDGVPEANYNNAVKTPAMQRSDVVKLMIMGSHWELKHITKSLTQGFMKYIILMGWSKP